WITFLIGTLALIGTPFFSGFYSKDSIIEAVGLSHLPGSGFAYFAVVAGVFVTAFYSFRLYFLVFHGKERFGHPVPSHDLEGGKEDSSHGHGKPHESPWVVTFPLIMLAIPSVVIGYIAIQPMLFGDYFQGAIFVSENHPAMKELMHEFHGAFAMAIHALTTLPFWLALSGAGTAWLFYMKRPDIPEAIKQRFSLVYAVLDHKYGFDEFNDWFFAGGARLIGRSLWKGGDVAVIDGFFVNGTARLIGWFSSLTRRLQSGYIYHYAFAMIIGVFVLMTLFVKG
ncbi:MAG: proton-conducting transporter membrane subunit, partial [Sulfuricella sp.]